MCCVRWCRCAISLLSVSLIATCGAQAPNAGGQTSPPPPEVVTTTGAASAAMFKPTPENTYPQIVRLSYVEGDVRLSRRAVDAKTTGADWEKAVTGTPLETGYSVVTEAGGRAEIEFEDASTAYVGENSVVVCNNLITTDGVPMTDLGLLNGVMTLHVKTLFPEQTFMVETPTNGVVLKYPMKSYVRVNSYLDAMTITAMGTTGAKMFVGGRAVSTDKEQSMTYRAGRWVHGDGGVGSFADWDKWVDDRVIARKAVMETAEKDAGLAAPIPGLVEMSEAGTFFPCEGYGTCWQPTSGWGGGQGAGVAGVAGLAAGKRLVAEDEDYFPCSPDMYRSWYEKDLVTHKKKLLYTEELNGGPEYLWGVCHTGSWVHYQGRYAWVRGEKRHHHCPIHWVKDGKRTGYVPLHPHDVAGKTPVAMKHAVWVAGDKHAGAEPGKDFKLLAAAPKEFRNEAGSKLERAETPRMEARSLGQSMLLARGGVEPAKMPGNAITFDHKSQSFVLARSFTMGGKVQTVSEPIVGRVGGIGGERDNVGRGTAGSAGGGASIARGSYTGGNGGGISRGSAGGGGYSGGGAVRGGSSSGGGGVSSGGGGASHGGGGGGSSGGGGGGGASAGGGGGGGGAGHK